MRLVEGHDRIHTRPPGENLARQAAYGRIFSTGGSRGIRESNQYVPRGAVPRPRDNAESAHAAGRLGGGASGVQRRQQA